MKKNKMIFTVLLVIASLFIASHSYVWAGPILQYPVGGSYSGWPTTWTALPGTNDPGGDASGFSAFDIIGDTYIAKDATYLYFRLGINTTITSSTYSPGNEGSIFVFIDVKGFNYMLPDGNPDYAISWDTKGTVKTEHGMEFNIATATAFTMDDIDGKIGQKEAPPDINKEGDGYLRSIDGPGGTSFLDYAIKWSYLAAHSQITPDSTIGIWAGSVHEQTDHAYPSTDLTSGSGPILLGSGPPLHDYGTKALQEYMYVPGYIGGLNGTIISVPQYGTITNRTASVDTNTDILQLNKREYFTQTLSDAFGVVMFVDFTSAAHQAINNYLSSHSMTLDAIVDFKIRLNSNSLGDFIDLAYLASGDLSPTHYRFYWIGDTLALWTVQNISLGTYSYDFRYEMPYVAIFNGISGYSTDITKVVYDIRGDQVTGPEPPPVPEPATVISALIGLFGFAVKRFTRK